jgi:membrane protein implicated in regulation of membrane protease activity
MKKETFRCVSIVIPLVVAILWALLALVQLWTEIMSSVFFTRISVSAAIVIAISVLVAMVFRDFFEVSELKEKGYLGE